MVYPSSSMSRKYIVSLTQSISREYVLSDLDLSLKLLPMSTNQPTPTGFQNLDRVVDHKPQTAADLEHAKILDELRRKLSASPPLPQKSKWRFW
jgi:hypothetical protein